MGPRSPEAKLARKIEDGLNVYEFNDSFCAYMLHRTHGKIQARLFNIFMNLVYKWAEDLENGHFDSDTYEITIHSKRIQEAIERFGYTLKE